MGGTRGDFVELDLSSLARPLPHVRINCTYDAPAVDVFDNQVAVVIGIDILIFSLPVIVSSSSQFPAGVTPSASVLKHAWYRQKRDLGSLCRVKSVVTHPLVGSNPFCKRWKPLSWTVNTTTSRDVPIVHTSSSRL